MKTRVMAEERSSPPSGFPWTFPLRPVGDSDTAAATVHVLVTGAIFNARDLKVRHGLSAEASDTTLVERLFRIGGARALEQMRGAFAAAVHDAGNHTAVIMRDHAGLHPLFYAVTAEDVTFASSAKDLARLPHVASALNRVALADALVHRYPDPEETFFASVRRVPAGCRASITHGALRIDRYWDPFAQEQSRASTADLLAEFEAIQDQAISRVVDPGRTAIFLSGGLDSGSVALIAANRARIEGQPLPLALSLTFPDPSCDETETQNAVARELGLEHHVLDFATAVGGTPLLEQALAYDARLSAPLMGLWNAPYDALARVGAAHGATTVVTGVGGDEWQAASAWHVADLLRRGRVRQALRLNAEWKRSAPGDLLIGCGLRPLAGMLPGYLAPAAWDRSRTRRHIAADPAWLARDTSVRQAQLDRAHRTLRPAVPQRSFAAADTAVNLTHTLSQQSMEESFERFATAGVVFRHPYYDADLIDLMCRLPLRVMNVGGQLKGPIRRQLAKRFPGLGYDRQQKVLATDFFTVMLHRQLWRLSEDAIEFPTLADLGVVDGAGARAFARDFVRTKVPNRAAAIRIWDLMNLEVWTRHQNTVHC